jgi:redox-sensitive bicupin YhaK (pirin superfamily)
VSAQLLDVAVADGQTALIYVYEGEVAVGEQAFTLHAGQLARLTRSGALMLAASAGARLLVITGKPIGEPIVQRGPFVMNTAEEIHQAIRDYSDGKLVTGGQ